MIESPKYLRLWHGTTTANHKKILRSGKFKAGTYFTDKEEIARQYSRMAVRTERSAIVMFVAIAEDALRFDGYYWTCIRDVHFRDSIYQ